MHVRTDGGGLNWGRANGCFLGMLNVPQTACRRVCHLAITETIAGSVRAREGVRRGRREEQLEKSKRERKGEWKKAGQVIRKLMVDGIYLISSSISGGGGVRSETDFSLLCSLFGYGDMEKPVAINARTQMCNTALYHTDKNPFGLKKGTVF